MIVAVILGIVQALTEFLPVSSSAHLLVVPWLFHWADPGLGFDAALHVGTSLALVAYFWGDFVKIIKDRSPLLKLIIIASIPGGVIGFLGEKIIDSAFHEGSWAIVIMAVGMLIATAIIWQIDARAAERKSISKLTTRDSWLIGIGQALALIPGVSRSGSTIAAGLAIGLKREEAARFSFLIGTPIALGAGLYKLYGLAKLGTAGTSWSAVIVGVLVAGGLGWLVIRWLLGYLQKNTLRSFLYYRIAFAVVVLLIVVARS